MQSLHSFLRTSAHATNLLDAVRRNDETATSQLLKLAWTDVNIAGQFDGSTPLHIACKRNQIRMVRMLVNAEADLERRDAQGRTALLVAAREGHVAVFNFLLASGSDPYARTSRELHNALHLASAGGHTEMVSTMTETQLYADRVDDIDAKGRTPLHMACNLKDSGVAYDMSKILIRCGADAIVKNVDGYAPLHLACERGHGDAVRVFLSKVANSTDDTRRLLKTKTRFGNTALDIAVLNMNVQCTAHLTSATVAFSRFEEEQRRKRVEEERRKQKEEEDAFEAETKRLEKYRDEAKQKSERELAESKRREEREREESEFIGLL